MCNFHSIDQENDVGMDGQIELFDENRLPIGKLICVQIKTGKSYYDLNKSECYASIIADAILNQPDIASASVLLNSLDIEYTTTIKKQSKPIIDFVKKEQLLLDQENFNELVILYNSYPTVWNNLYSSITKCELTVDNIKQTNDFYLFTTYYATNYNGF